VEEGEVMVGPWEKYQQRTAEGRPIVQNADGSVSTERTITIGTDAGYLNIPTMYGGKELDPDSAVEMARRNNWTDKETGRKFDLFKTQQEAETAAQTRSKSLGAKYGQQQGPWTKYQQKPAEIETMPAGAPSQIEAPEDTWRGTVSRFARPALEGAGAAIGGIVGTGAGLATGPGAPIASPALGVAGGAGGYAIGKNIADRLDETLGLRQPQGMADTAVETASDLGTGAALEMGGQVAGPIIGAAVRKAGQGIGAVAKPLIGKITGAGPEAITQALKGEGLTQASSPFVQGMRGGVGSDDLLSEAKGALSTIKANRGALYRERLEQMSQNKTPIDLRPIKNKTSELMRRYNIRIIPDASGVPTVDFSRSRLDKKGISDARDIIEKVSGWGREAGDNTPMGLDTLKGQLDDFYSDSKGTQAFVTELRNFVKGQIVKNVPEYAQMTNDYSQVSGVVKEIERALSLNNRAMADTAVKKLLSTTRDNFEFRKELAQTLSQMGEAPDLPARIAGAAMSPIMPKGLAGLGAAGGAYYSGFDPQIVALASLSSPRLMGELLNTLGFTRNQAAAFLKFANQGGALGRSSAFAAGADKGDQP
jgi:hypothetical protein